jgi:hypothetical protein
MGLDEVPVPRTAVPEPNRPIPAWFKPKFYKALQLVDMIETYAFERFIPNHLVIDKTLDARSYGPDNSFAVCIRIDKPPPSNDQLWRATGIKPTWHPEALQADNLYRWLGIEVARLYAEYGATAMAPPLVFRTKGSRWNPLVVPILGAVCKFEIKVPAGLTREDIYPNVGCLIPSGTYVKPEHRVTPLVTNDAGSEIGPYDSGRAFATNRPGEKKSS